MKKGVYQDMREHIVELVVQGKKNVITSYLWENNFYFLLDIFFIYIENVIPFPGFPSRTPCSPTQPLLLPGPCIPLHWGIEPSQDQGPLLPLMTDKAILCYICSWNHVYSLVGGLVPGSYGDLVGWYCCSDYGFANTFNSFRPFSNSSIGDPTLSSMVDWEHLPLYF